ncbi:hypothetical protein [Agathobaculum sp.]|uniref:hypothetical protein n=1 Tax=Agathobaculum sp. TaxID=2048138 RepID=UPI00399FB4E6
MISYYTTLLPFRQTFFRVLHNFRQSTDYLFLINANFVLSSEKHLSTLQGTLQSVSAAQPRLQRPARRAADGAEPPLHPPAAGLQQKENSPQRGLFAAACLKTP